MHAGAMKELPLHSISSSVAKSRPAADAATGADVLRLRMKTLASMQNKTLQKYNMRREYQARENVLLKDSMAHGPQACAVVGPPMRHLEQATVAKKMAHSAKVQNNDKFNSIFDDKMPGRNDGNSEILLERHLKHFQTPIQSKSPTAAAAYNALKSE